MKPLKIYAVVATFPSGNKRVMDVSVNKRHAQADADDFKSWRFEDEPPSRRVTYQVVEFYPRISNK